MAEENRVKVDKERPNVTANAKIRNNATSKKLSEAFLAEDVSNAKSYILWDVLMPSVKDVFSQTLHSTIDAILGTRRGGSYGRQSYGSGYGSHTNYSKISSTSRERDIDRSYNTYTFDDIELDDSGVANLILDELNDIIDEYGSCSVNDYFETVRQYVRNLRIEMNPQDVNYGWTSLRSAQVMRAGRGMYYIKFPRVRPLK